MKDCFLSIDVGTTTIKVSAVSDSFELLACTGLEYKLHTEDNRVTLPAEVYWEKAAEGIRKIAAQVGADRIAGIAVTTQGETMIPVDEAGNVLYDAVVWLDARAGEQAEEILGVVSAEEFYARTGVPECNELCPVSKILWFKEKEPQIYEKAKYFLLLEDYMLFCLTGKFVTEKSLLSTTGYFDIMKDTLWQELFDRLSLDVNKIPTVHDCGEVIGTLQKETAEELGLSEATPVVTGAMDQVCGALGAGNFLPGMLTETTGTALCIGKTIAKAPVEKAGAIPVYRHYRKDLQLLLPVCMTAGMALKWFKDTFCEKEMAEAARTGEDVYELLNRLAEQSEPLAGGMFMLPYLAGSLQPLQAPDYRGGFMGVGLNNTKADFVRALMEGVSYMLQENLELLAQKGSNGDTLISMGGGARSAVWCQIKADVTGLAIHTLQESETASVGAAMLCRMGVYGEKELSAGKLESTVKKEFLPREEWKEKYRAGYEKYSQYLQKTIEVSEG